MPDSQTADLARKFIRVWSVGNLELIDRLADPDIVVSYSHFPEPLEGRVQFREMLEETFHYFPDLVTTPRKVIAGTDTAAVEWVYEGTHENGEMFGVEAHGTRVRVRGVTIYEMQEGRIHQERGVVDVLGLMGQLGAM